MKNNKTDKLLACLEDIDERFITEAAEAVKNRYARRYSWLSMGNVAAVFIGAVAILGILVLAFWLGNMGYMPAHDENNNGYYTEDSPTLVTPTPEPEKSLLFPYGLPLPRIHDSWIAILLDEGQTHMTINNPWHDIDHIDALPVFLPLIRLEERGTGYWQATRNERITDEDWDLHVYYFHRAIKELAYTLGMDMEDVDFDDFYQFGKITTSYSDGIQVSIEASTLNSRIVVRFVPLLGAAFPEDATPEELIMIFQHLAAISLPHLRLPDQGQLGISHGADGVRRYLFPRIFDPGITAIDAILAFNFEWVEVSFLLRDQHQEICVSISSLPQRCTESLHLGYFPIITAEEARELLLDGYFISERSDNEWSGREAAFSASVELVYHTTDSDVIMPFYRFLVEETASPWRRETPGLSPAFGRYYVPAVHRDYLEPMTRRATPERSTPPTGHRALPPDVYLWLHVDSAYTIIPLNISRLQVDCLWQEVLDEIGELAPNEAYQFRTACGRYAMINGARNLTSMEEMRKYYPRLGLPELDEFTLIEVFVNDRSNVMIIHDKPMPSFVAALFSFDPRGATESPVDEIFIRETEIGDASMTSAFYAVYEHRNGLQVGFGVSSLFFDARSGLPDEHEVVDMGEYGIIYFVGSDGLYYKAVYEPQDPWGVAVELWFHHGPIENRFNYLDLRYGNSRFGYDRFGDMFVAVPREDLEELVRLFNPAALAWEHQWQLMSWQ